MAEVIPRYFVQSKYESFTRQLSGWGFKRLHQAGNDHNSYYHECFLRDMPELTCLIRRLPPNLGKFPGIHARDAEQYLKLVSVQLRSAKVDLATSIQGGGTVFDVGKKGSAKLREVWHGSRVSASAMRPPVPPHPFPRRHSSTWKRLMRCL